MASLEEIRAERLKKLELLKQAGKNPYPILSNPDFNIAEVIRDFAELTESGKELSLAGRVMAIRTQGAITFFNFNDGTGLFQGLLKSGEIDAPTFDLFKDTVDLGDFILVRGTLFVTKRNEPTIQVKDWTMLAKSLRPLPDKWHGLQDVEERFRRRYLDSLMSGEVKKRFILRSQIITAIRKYLDDAGYLEVETPILQPLAGGANAEPFKTHHNALNIDLYLRIAPELYLKKMLVGGFPKVYELARNFRNEGIDATHNPEFTMLEFYESFSTAKKQMVFVEELVRTVVKNVIGREEIEFDGVVIDFAEKFKTISYTELLARYAFINDLTKITRAEAVLKANQFGVEVDPADVVEKIIDNIYKKICRPKIIQPTFIVDYPVAFSPFAKRKEDNPELIDRFQLLVGGYELVNAFSELNDPLDQRERYLEQDRKKKAGDAEVSSSDEDYLECMEYGMPPAGGVGLGVDRLTMVLTNTKNIKEVIFFPTMRPKDKEDKG